MRIYIQMSNLGGATTTDQTFRPEVTQNLPNYVDANGNYMDIPGPIYLMTQYVYNPSDPPNSMNAPAWLNTSDNVGLSMTVGAVNILYYQNKQLQFQTPNGFFPLQCITTAPTAVRISSSSTSPDTFTWSQTTGLLVHDQSGLNVELASCANRGGDFVLHQSGRDGMTNNLQVMPTYTFDVL